MKTVFCLLVAITLSMNVNAQESSISAQNKEAVQKFIMFLNQKDWINHIGFIFSTKDFEAFNSIHSEFRAAFPDYHFESEMLTAQGDKVIVIGTVSGTHSKTWSLFPEIPATGKKIMWKEIWVLTLKDGKSIGGEILNDRLSILSQLGYDCKILATKP